MFPLEAEIAPKLKALGFRKKARTWWRKSEGAVQVINIQKSEFGDQLYVNLGLYLKRMGEEEFPPERRCHIRSRLERVVPEELFEEVRSAVATEEPSQKLVESIVVVGAEWLSKLSTEQGLQQFLSTGLAQKCFVHRALVGK